MALLGDTAHAMCPVGSSGASQAMVDACVLGGGFMQHRVNPGALRSNGDQVCADISAPVLRNCSAGPFGLLSLMHERCGGVFDNIDRVIPAAEREAFKARHKVAVGFAMDALNAAPPSIAPGPRVRAG